MQLPVLLGLVRVNKPGPGRPRTRLNSLAGDKAYSSKANRDTLRTTRTRCTIPEREDRGMEVYGAPDRSIPVRDVNASQ